MSPSHPDPRRARPRVMPPALPVAMALVLAVCAALWGAAEHPAAQGAGSSASAAPGRSAPGSGPGSGPGNVWPRGVVRVDAHCTMTAANSLVPAAGATPAGGDPEAPQVVRRGGGIPADFEPVAVIACGMATDTAPNGAVRQSAVEQRATQDLEPLLVAYQSPMPSFGIPEGCTAELDTDPVIAFVDARGDAIWPGAPRDACHHVSRGVQAALSALKWTLTDSKPV